MSARKTRIWGFVVESVARRCAKLATEATSWSARQITIERDDADNAWVLYVEEPPDNIGRVRVAWLQGFACGFARSLPDETDLDGGAEVA